MEVGEKMRKSKSVNWPVWSEEGSIFHRKPRGEEDKGMSEQMMESSEFKSTVWNFSHWQYISSLESLEQVMT